MNGEDKETLRQFRVDLVQLGRTATMRLRRLARAKRNPAIPLGRPLRRCDRHGADRRAGARVAAGLPTADNDAGRRWRDMLENLGTVATQSVQIWVNQETRTLGWTHGQVSFSAFVHPFDTWADLSQLVEVENQPGAAWRALFLQRAARTGRAGDWTRDGGTRGWRN